ncbi:hypothetical protein Peur_001832 [Populus x canadensis]
MKSRIKGQIIIHKSLKQFIVKNVKRTASKLKLLNASREQAETTTGLSKTPPQTSPKNRLLPCPLLAQVLVRSQNLEQ